jgi:predicted dehydrogenase
MNTQGGNVVLTAVADVFQQRVDDTLKSCEARFGERVQSANAKFIGFDAYKSVLESDIDLVILATPPGFRPLHYEAAIEAGKHVFMEKPVAVDAPGVRRVLAANEKARQKNLAVGVGLQRRHERAYRETVARLQDGIIGDLVVSRVYWNNPGVWVRGRTPGQTELEYQMSNWYYFNWLCGDHIVEQHIHNMDVVNWVLDAYPVSAQGMGGRAVRTGKDHGQIYDHHMVEFTFANGHKMFSQCRHIPECWDQVSEHVHGTKGYADVSAGRIFDLSGKELFHSTADRGGHQQEHHDLFADLRGGTIPNEGQYGAKSTMTAILGRLATYTGKMLKWEDAINSNIRLADIDQFRSMNDAAPVQPDSNGKYPIALPGVNYEGVIDWEA